MPSGVPATSRHRIWSGAASGCRSSKPASANKKGDKHEAEEKDREKAKDKPRRSCGENDEGEGGEILLVVEVISPDGVNFRDAKNGMYVYSSARRWPSRWASSNTSSSWSRSRRGLSGSKDT